MEEERAMNHFSFQVDDTRASLFMYYAQRGIRDFLKFVRFIDLCPMQFQQYFLHLSPMILLQFLNFLVQSPAVGVILAWHHYFPLISELASHHAKKMIKKKVTSRLQLPRQLMHTTKLNDG
jgi:hypothetical protein